MSIEELFLAAVEKENAEERFAYLAAACGGNAALRAEVEALLKSHEEAGSVLEQPIFQTRIDAPLAVGAGTIISHYKLLQQLGEGGMGAVFLAEQTEPVQRYVALKIIKPGMDSKAVLARFEAERQALALMDHPNIAKVLDAGTTDEGRPYFVMELVKGVPITRYCDDKRLTPTERLQLFLPVCHAVQHAHHKGIIHRDLKPTNVLIALYDGVPVPKVIDFGVAKATGGKLTRRTLFTEVGSIVGTFEYMSPEQAELNNLDVDTRSDVYSLGVLLYELLTGTTPLERSRIQDAGVMELLRRIREDETPRPSMRLSTIQDLDQVAEKRGIEPRRLSGLMRGELDWIVLKALEKSRNRRYETANALANDVQHYLNDEPVQACPPSLGYQLRKLFRRHKRAALVAAFIVTLLLLAVVGRGFLKAEELNDELRVEKLRADGNAQKADDARRQAEKNEQDAKAARGRERDARELAAELRYARQLELALQQWKQGNVIRARDLLDDLESQARVLGGGKPAFEWVLVRRLIQQHRQIAFYGHKNGVRSPSFSPDGKHLASTDGTITIRDLRTGQTVRTIPRGGGTVLYSPDGGRLASIAGREAKIYDVETGNLLHTLPQPRGGVASICFSPDGQRLAGAGMGGPITVWDAQTGRVLLQFSAQMNGISHVCFSADGTRLACGCGNGSSPCVAKIWDAQTGRHVRTLSGHEDGVVDVRPSPDGQWWVSAGRDKTVRLWDAQTGQLVRTLRGHTDEVWRVCFSPEGQRIASAGKDRKIKVWDAWTGQELFTLVGHVDTVGRICFSPDGQLLASSSSDRTLRLWDARNGQEVAHVKIDLELAVTHLSFSPTEHLLAFSVGDGPGGEVSLWDARTERLTRTLWSGRRPNGWAPPAAATRTCFSPDGQRVAAVCMEGQRSGETVRIWEATTGREVLTISAGNRRIVQLRFSGDGLRLVGAGPGGVRSWDARTGKELRALKLNLGGSANFLSFSPDLRRLATAINRSPVVNVWDVETGKLLASLPGHRQQAYCVKFSPDGERLATGSEDGTLRIWDSRSGQNLLTMPGNGIVIWSACFTPDGRRLATGNEEGIVQIWDVQTGVELLSLPTLEMDVETLAFSHDGQRLAASGMEGIIKVWDARPVPRELMLTGHAARVRTIGFTPDSKRLVSQDLDQNKIVWDLSTGKPITGAKPPETMPGPRSPDGKLWANVEKNRIRIVSVSEPRDLVKEHPWLQPGPAWRREQAFEAEYKGQWPVAAFHHERLFREHEPWSTERLLRYGYALARMGQTDEGALHVTAALLRDPKLNWRPHWIKPPTHRRMPRAP